MTFIEQSKQVDPMGETKPTRANGVVRLTSTSLDANGVWDTGWIDTTGYTVIYLISFSDKQGSLQISFSGDGVNTLTSSAPRTAIPNAFFRNPFGVITK